MTKVHVVGNFKQWDYLVVCNFEESPERFYNMYNECICYGIVENCFESTLRQMYVCKQKDVPTFVSGIMKSILIPWVTTRLLSCPGKEKPAFTENNKSEHNAHYSNMISIYSDTQYGVHGLVYNYPPPIYFVCFSRLFHQSR